MEGTHLGRQVLLENAKPGDKVLIAINMPPTSQWKHFESAPVLVRFEASKPDPEVVRTELIAASELLPMVTQDAAALSSQEKVLDSAASAVSIAALDQGDQQAFDASFKKAQKANLRHGEEWLLNAEKYSSLTWLGG